MTSPRPYVISLATAGPRMIAAVHARVQVTSIPATFRLYLDQVYAAARSGSIQVDGQNVFVYRDAADQPGAVDVAFGVGVTAPFTAVGNVEPTPLPVGPVATTTHWGNYGGLRAAHRAVVEWCRAHGHRMAGPHWEVYGHWTDDEAQLRTDVFFLLDTTHQRQGDR